MEQINAQVKKWGNSLGIVLPKRLVENQELKEGVKINIIVNTKENTTVGELMRFAKKNKLKLKKENVKKIMEEIDEELW